MLNRMESSDRQTAKFQNMHGELVTGLVSGMSKEGIELGWEGVWAYAHLSLEIPR